MKGDLQTPKIAKQLKVFDVKGMTEGCNKIVENVRVDASNDNVINIKGNINNISLMQKDKERGIKKRKIVNAMKPSVRDYLRP